MHPAAQTISRAVFSGDNEREHSSLCGFERKGTECSSPLQVWRITVKGFACKI